MIKAKSQQQVFGDKLPNVGSKFNIYECDDFRARPVPYSRRDFYKITLQFGTSRLEYADKGILIDKPALLFTNPEYHTFGSQYQKSRKDILSCLPKNFIRKPTPMLRWKIHRCSGLDLTRFTT